jgi:hypothetical protein
VQHAGDLAHRHVLKIRESKHPMLLHRKLVNGGLNLSVTVFIKRHVLRAQTLLVGRRSNHLRRNQVRGSLLGFEGGLRFVSRRI